MLSCPGGTGCTARARRGRNYLDALTRRATGTPVLATPSAGVGVGVGVGGAKVRPDRADHPGAGEGLSPNSPLKRPFAYYLDGGRLSQWGWTMGKGRVVMARLGAAVCLGVIVVALVIGGGASAAHRRPRRGAACRLSPAV